VSFRSGSLTELINKKFFIFKTSPMNKTIIFFLAAAILFSSCVTNRTAEQIHARQLQKGKITEDTSYIYALPYENNSSHFLIQGYYSALSHKQRAALDFVMKRGTKILAARDGVVARLKEDSDKGGWSRKNLSKANYVIIQHADGTRSGYWHLQQNGVLVNLGDSVKVGQPIALSGKTGYAAMPHLHFMVWRPTSGNWQQIPTRFLTSKGVRYLKPFKRYRKKDQVTSPSRS
jgi:murein DD-endopeptidase MepM/ murein hydrolase activator NlpD